MKTQYVNTVITVTRFLQSLKIYYITEHFPDTLFCTDRKAIMMEMPPMIISNLIFKYRVYKIHNAALH